MCQGRALTQEVTDAAGVGAESDGIQTRYSREINQRRGAEERHVPIVLDILEQHRLAIGSARSSVIAEAVGGTDKQVMSASRNHRAIRDDTDENGVGVAVS